MFVLCKRLSRRWCCLRPLRSSYANLATPLEERRDIVLVVEVENEGTNNRILFLCSVHYSPAHCHRNFAIHLFHHYFRYKIYHCLFVCLFVCIANKLFFVLPILHFLAATLPRAQIQATSQGWFLGSLPKRSTTAKHNTRDAFQSADHQRPLLFALISFFEITLQVRSGNEEWRHTNNRLRMRDTAKTP